MTKCSSSSFAIVLVVGFVSLGLGQRPQSGCTQNNLLAEKGPDFAADKEACFANLPPTRTGKRGQRIKFDYCNEDSICRPGAGGYKYQLDEVRVSGSALAEGGRRTVLFRASTVKMCMFGRMASGVSSSGKLQLSVHGNIEHILDAFIDPAVPFCDIGVDLCRQTGSSCNLLTQQQPVKNFCSCTSIKVPSVPGEDKIFVKTTLKALESPAESDLDRCEQEYDISDLKAKGKNTLTCIKIPSILGKARRRGAGKR